MPFRNRIDAGRQLARRLEHVRGSDVVVTGLPRGGVPVAAEVAKALGAPLDVIVVRKLGVPYQPELAMGAVGEGGVRVVNDDVLRSIGLTKADVDAVAATEQAELERRVARFRGGEPRVDLAGRTVIVVDDGIATGATARAACQVARAHGAERVVLAAPVAPPTTAEMFAEVADEVVVVETPARLAAIGQWYIDFSQTSDREVVELLAAARHSVHDDPGLDREVDVPVGELSLPGHLTVPDHARGIVVFAHGSGSGRHSPRNRMVSEVLNTGGIGTMLLDLLTPEEERDRANVFDIDLLGRRLRAAVDWLDVEGAVDRRGVGLFGASTGAAAALSAAVDLAEADKPVDAVVSRGGRPDLAGDRLAEVRAPTLLIVGSRDPAVLRLNREAQTRLGGESQLSIVPGATHLFEESGTLDQVAVLARDWFSEHFKPD